MTDTDMRYNFKRAIFYIVLFCFIMILSLSVLIFYDYDLWARLIAGMSVVQTGIVLKKDFLSYTPTHIWYDHEWGSSVIFYLIFKFFGPKGFMITQALVLFFTMFFVSKTVELRGVKTTIPFNILFYILALNSMDNVIESPIRCQVFSFLFFSIYLFILEKARRCEYEKWSIYGVFGLPLFLGALMIIWNNLHGGCVSGICLIAIYFLGEFLNKKPIKKYLYALVATFVVLPINPWGFAYIPFLFMAATMQRTYITEWWSIFSKFFTESYITFKIFISVLLFAEFIYTIKNLINKRFDFDKTKVLAVSTTVILAIAHAKMVPFAVITASCFLYDDFYKVFNAVTFNLFNKIALVKDSVVYGLIFVSMIYMFNASKLDPPFDFKRLPVLSVEFIKINEIRGNLLTDFGYGSYVSYKLYPQNKIFMDGRYEEVYYDYLIPLLRDFHIVSKNWNKILIEYPPDVIILSKFYPIYNKMQQQKDWALVYDKDLNYGVFVKRDKLKKEYKQPSYDINHYKETLFDTDINFVLQSKNEKKR